MNGDEVVSVNDDSLPVSPDGVTSKVVASARGVKKRALINQLALSLPTNFNLPSVYDPALVNKLSKPDEIFWPAEISRYLRLIGEKMYPHTLDMPSNADYAFILDLLKTKYKHFVLNGNPNLLVAEVSALKLLSSFLEHLFYFYFLNYRKL